MIASLYSLLLIVIFFVAQPGWAVMHIDPKAYAHPFRDQIHHPTAAQVHAMGSIQAAVKAGAVGTKTIAVIVVQFPASSCGGCTSGSNSIVSLAAVDTRFTNMKNYYLQASYGQLTLAFKFFGPNTANVNGDPDVVTAGAYTFNGAGGTPNHPMEYYGCGDEGLGCVGVTPPQPGINANGDFLIHDALTTALAGHSNTPKSISAGGIFDSVIVIHAGNGNETTVNTNGDIWSIFYSQDAEIQAAGAGFTEGDVDPDTETGGITSALGVMCHEFGHSLGLPDLYNTTAVGGSSVDGYWELMDLGPYLNAGANPAHPCVWDKQFLGWLTPTVAAAKMNTSFSYVETNPSALKIPVQNGGPQEYFLVEYRSPSSPATYDHYIAGAGLLIWHVDDAITSSRGINASDPSQQNTVNSGSPHYGVSIIPADGVAVASNPKDPNTPFGNNHNFTSPSSDNFSAQPSGISIVNIAGVGTPTVSAQVANLATTAGQSILKLINYPNPAGKGYAHPNGAGHTTLQMQLTRPASDYGFNIYTLSGDLVRKVGSSDITLDLDRSSDDKWVYEFVWDLKNGEGHMVAPGVYLYLGRADGKSESNKAVIIR